MIDERNQERVLLDPGATHVETDRTGATYLVQRDARPWLLLLSLIAVLVDRLTKLYVVAHLQTGQAVTVIPHVFRITHVLNFGAAFSMFAESASPEALYPSYRHELRLAAGAYLARCVGQDR